MTTYERITYRPEGGRRAHTIILQDVREMSLFGAQALTGIEVRQDGDEVSGKGFDERRHIIMLLLVTRRQPLLMDNHYGLLVPVEERPHGGLR